MVLGQLSCNGFDDERDAESETISCFLIESGWNYDPLSPSISASASGRLVALANLASSSRMTMKEYGKTSLAIQHRGILQC